MPSASLRSVWEELLGVTESKTADHKFLAGRVRSYLHSHPAGAANVSDGDIHDLAVTFLNSDLAKAFFQTEDTATGLNLRRDYHYILTRIERILRLHRRIKRKKPWKRRSLTAESDLSEGDVGSSAVLDRPRRRTTVTNRMRTSNPSIDSLDEAISSSMQDDEIPESDDAEENSEWNPSKEPTEDISSPLSVPGSHKRAISLFNSSPPARHTTPKHARRSADADEVTPDGRHLASIARPPSRSQPILMETPSASHGAMTGPCLSVSLPHLRGKAWKFESVDKMAALLGDALIEVDRTLEKQARRARVVSKRAYLEQSLNHLDVYECVDKLLKDSGAELVDRYLD